MRNTPYILGSTRVMNNRGVVRLADNSRGRREEVLNDGFEYFDDTDIERLMVLAMRSLDMTSKERLDFFSECIKKGKYAILVSAAIISFQSGYNFTSIDKNISQYIKVNTITQEMSIQNVPLSTINEIRELTTSEVISENLSVQIEERGNIVDVKVQSKPKETKVLDEHVLKARVIKGMEGVASRHGDNINNVKIYIQRGEKYIYELVGTQLNMLKGGNIYLNKAYGDLIKIYGTDQNIIEAIVDIMMMENIGNLNPVRDGLEVLYRLGKNDGAKFRIHQSSSVGARGLFQITPNTFKSLQKQYGSIVFRGTFMNITSDHKKSALAAICKKAFDYRAMQKDKYFEGQRGVKSFLPSFLSVLTPEQHKRFTAIILHASYNAGINGIIRILNTHPEIKPILLKKSISDQEFNKVISAFKSSLVSETSYYLKKGALMSELNRGEYIQEDLTSITERDGENKKAA